LEVCGLNQSFLKNFKNTYYPAGYPTGKPDSDHIYRATRLSTVLSSPTLVPTIRIVRLRMACVRLNRLLTAVRHFRSCLHR